MSKTLVERLCQWAKADGAGIWGEAADRIEELEAQLKQEKRKSDLLLLAANTWQDKCEAGLKQADIIEREAGGVYHGTNKAENDQWVASANNAVRRIRKELGGSDE